MLAWISKTTAQKVDERTLSLLATKCRRQTLAGNKVYVGISGGLWTEGVKRQRMVENGGLTVR